MYHRTGKMTKIMVTDYAKRIINKHYTELKYLLFGGLSFVINIIMYYLLTEVVKSNALIGNVVAWIVSTLFAFITNKVFVFIDSKKKNSGAIRELLFFFVGRLSTLLIEGVLLYILVNKLELSNIPIKISVTAFVIIINYFISKYYIF